MRSAAAWTLFGRTAIDETPALIDANSEAVRRILRNILKNALVHGTGSIDLSLRQTDGDVIFRCTNRCKSPDAIDPDHVFTRFYKADPAQNGRSTGLGLTIAHGLTQKLGGTISAARKDDRFTITLTFPLC